MEKRMMNFDKYLDGYYIPEFSNRTGYICLNCGYRPLIMDEKECPVCSDSNVMGNNIIDKNAENTHALSILFGKVLFAIINNAALRHLRQEDSIVKKESIDEIIQFKDELLKEVYAEFETWYEKNNIMQLDKSMVLGKWINGNSLCFEDTDLIEYYFNSFCDEIMVGTGYFIKELQIKKMFGYRDVDIKFNEDISIILGVNGIGKTTIFNIIEALLVGSRSTSNALKTKENVEKLNYILNEIPFSELHIFFNGGAQIDVKKTAADDIIPFTISQYSKMEIFYLGMHNLSGFTPLNAELKPVEINNSLSKTEANRHFSIISKAFNQYNQDAFLFIRANRLRLTFVDDFNLKLKKIWSDIYACVEKVRSKKPGYIKLSSKYRGMLGNVINNNLFISSLGVDIVLDTIEWVDYEYSRNSVQKKMEAAIRDLYHFWTKYKDFQEAFSAFYATNSDLPQKMPWVNPNKKDDAFTLSFKCSFNIDGQRKKIIDLLPENLSTGEQNVAQLLYSVIFCVTDKPAIILIDEPEISLHIVWQYSLLNVVEAINHNKNVQVIVATHSPYISMGRDKMVIKVD